MVPKLELARPRAMSGFEIVIPNERDVEMQDVAPGLKKGALGKTGVGLGAGSNVGHGNPWVGPRGNEFLASH